MTNFQSIQMEKPQGSVVIVCSKREEKNVKSSLTGQIHASVERDGLVSVIAIADALCRDKNFVTAQIRDQLPHGTPHLLVPQQITIDTEILSTSTYLRRPNGIRTLLRRDIPELLKQLHLDWIGHLEDTLRNGWHHAEIDRFHIERWIQQFEQCGRYQWVAEGLLKCLDFWSDTRTREALRIIPEALENFDCICVNRHAKAGKSADVIANLVRKQLDTMILSKKLPLLDFREALNSPDFNTILYVEDCCLSGNEMERVFKGLLGLPDKYGSLKATPLEDSSMLQNKQIVLRFAVVGNGGQAHIRQFLSRNTLQAIHLDTATSHVVSILTEEGLNALSSETLHNAEGYLLSPDQHVERSAFQFWPEPEKQERAKQFCTEVGRQLYACYLQSQGKQKTAQWISESALGVRSAALTLAFAHSIPKETLPLFWAQGRIQWNRKPFDWYPLFASAG